MTVPVSREPPDHASKDECSEKSVRKKHARWGFSSLRDHRGRRRHKQRLLRRATPLGAVNTAPQASSCIGRPHDGTRAPLSGIVNENKGCAHLLDTEELRKTRKLSVATDEGVDRALSQSCKRALRRGCSKFLDSGLPSAR